jgi:hypothetical protein
MIRLKKWGKSETGRKLLAFFFGCTKVGFFFDEQSGSRGAEFGAGMFLVDPKFCSIKFG